MATDARAGVLQSYTDMVAASKKDAITLAAIKCILKKGAAEISVDEIATAAGVSRRTFYRFFNGRRGIMETILLMRMSSNAVKVKAVLDRCQSLSEAIVLGVIESFKVIRKDRLYQSIAASERILMLELENKVHAEAFESIILGIWGGVFDRARELGELRADVTNGEAGEWLVGIMELFRQRDEVTPDPNDAYKIRMLRKFMLPSLMFSSPPEIAHGTGRTSARKDPN